MSYHTSVSSVLESAERTLEVAELGWRDYRQGGERRWAGLVNAVVSARSTTNVLQNLRGLVPAYDEWWTREREVLNNPVAQWFVNVRNAIEKQGVLGNTDRVIAVHSFNAGLWSALEAAQPRGTIRTIIGDDLGRNAWVVALPDGSTHKVYFSLPAENVDHYFEIENAPGGRRIEELYPQYFDQVKGLVEKAKREFS